MNKPTYGELEAAFRAAAEHLDWTGYGDSYERGCARDSGLVAEIEQMLKRLDGEEG